MADFADDYDDEEQPEGGKGLRAKLESEIRTNRQLQDQLAQYKAREVLTEKGLDLVKPEDLSGVPLDQLEARASEIQAERSQIKEQVLRDLLSSQGLEGDDLEEAVKEMAARRDAASEQADQVKRARALASVDSKPVPRVDPTQLHGYDAIRFAVENPKKR